LSLPVKHPIDVNIEGRTEVTKSRSVTDKEILDDLRKNRTVGIEKEALDNTLEGLAL